MSGKEESGAMADHQWDLWEVFLQETDGGPHVHAGSVRAPDKELALLNARDVYARRFHPFSIWVVPAAEITASSPDDAGPFFDPADDKVYRHPQFYKTPKVGRASVKAAPATDEAGGS